MKILRIVPFSEFYMWDVKSFFLQEDIFNGRHPLVLFGDFLTKPNIEKIKIEDTKEYKILGTRSYGKGVFVNRTVKGNTLKMRTYQLAKENHLFWCKVDTKNGAFGIVTKDLADGVASSNMTFAEIDISKANPEFVQLLFRSKRVNKYMDGYVTGTTNRKYIKPDQLRDEIKIVLPSLRKQNKIVANYNTKIQLAKQQEEQAKRLELDIENYLFEVLGIEKLEEKERHLLQVINYSNLDRWDNSKAFTLKSDYPIKRVNEIILDISTGTTPPTSRKDYFENGNINFYTPADLTDKMYLKKSERKITQLAIDDRKARKFEKDTLLFVGIGSTVGKVGIVKNKYATSNQQITGLKLNPLVTNIEFVYSFFNSFINITTKEKTQATIPIVNQNKILNIPIPIPPLEIQTKIVNHIARLKQQIQDLKNQAEQNQIKAIKEFEQEIFITD